jgi:hypothetical protein
MGFDTVKPEETLREKVLNKQRELLALAFLLPVHESIMVAETITITAKYIMELESRLNDRA